MLNVVTGSFGYIGKYITRKLLEHGEEVRTITTHPDKPNPFGNAVKAFSYNFDNPKELTASLLGATTLYNTYWIRFEYDNQTYRQTIKNTIHFLARYHNRYIKVSPRIYGMIFFMCLTLASFVYKF